MKANKEDLHVSGQPLTKEEFVDKIKTDEEFAKKWGELGPVYGRQWRRWRGREFPLGKGINNETIYIDQIANLVQDLRNNPDSRRLMVNAWNIAEIDDMVLPPCHYGFQVYTRKLNFDERWEIFESRGFAGTELKKPLINEKYNNVNCRDEYESFWSDPELPFNLPTRAISLMWNQRSVDTFLGLPFNIASYGLLLEILAKEVNMVPDQLIGNLGDVHLYSNHIEQAREQIGVDLTDEERYNIWFNNNYETGMERFFIPEQLPDFDNDYYEPTPKRTREPLTLPTLHINTEFWQTESRECGIGSLNTNLKGFEISDFILDNYQSHPTIKAPLSN